MNTPRDRYLALREMRHAPTRAEDALWKRLRDHQLSGLHFHRQYVKGKFTLDFYCRAGRLVVEVDGEIHESQAGRDAERDSYLSSEGLQILRFPNERVFNDISAVLHEIRAAATADPPAEDPPRPSRTRADPP
jgi:very-short-patch-repair endonuclease